MQAPAFQCRSPLQHVYRVALSSARPLCQLADNCSLWQKSLHALVVAYLAQLDALPRIGF